VSRTRFQITALHGNTTKKRASDRTRVRLTNATYGKKPKLISLVALANRNAKAGEKPTQH